MGDSLTSIFKTMSLCPKKTAGLLLQARCFKKTVLGGKKPFRRMAVVPLNFVGAALAVHGIFIDSNEYPRCLWYGR